MRMRFYPSYAEDSTEMLNVAYVRAIFAGYSIADVECVWNLDPEDQDGVKEQMVAMAWGLVDEA